MHINQRYVGSRRRWTPIADFYNSGIPVVLCKATDKTGYSLAASTTSPSYQLQAGSRKSDRNTRSAGDSKSDVAPSSVEDRRGDDQGRREATARIVGKIAQREEQPLGTVKGKRMAAARS